MKILKIPEPSFDLFEIETPTGKKTLPRLGIGGPLGKVLANLNLPYLCEVKEEVKRLKIKKEVFEAKKDYIKELYAREYLSREKQDLVPFEWGSEPGWSCLSYKDVTEIDNPFDEKIEKEYYSTAEVLQVIDQWIEYLEKFKAEKG